MKALTNLALLLCVFSSAFSQQASPAKASDSKPYEVKVIKKQAAPRSDKAFKAVIDEETTSIKITALYGKVTVYSMQWYAPTAHDDGYQAYSNGSQDLQPGPSYASTSTFGTSKFCWILVEYTNPKTGKRESIELGKPPAPDQVDDEGR
jgi:hypothetical protein